MFIGYYFVKFSTKFVSAIQFLITKKMNLQVSSQKVNIQWSLKIKCKNYEVITSKYFGIDLKINLKN